MEPIKVILNPVAGRGYGAKIEPELQRLLQAEGLDFDLVRTARPWHAAELPNRQPATASTSSSPRAVTARRTRWSTV